MILPNGFIFYLGGLMHKLITRWRHRVFKRGGAGEGSRSPDSLLLGCAGEGRVLTRLQWCCALSTSTRLLLQAGTCRAIARSFSIGVGISPAPWRTQNLPEADKKLRISSFIWALHSVLFVVSQPKWKHQHSMQPFWGNARGDPTSSSLLRKVLQAQALLRKEDTPRRGAGDDKNCGSFSSGKWGLLTCGCSLHKESPNDLFLTLISHLSFHLMLHAAHFLPESIMLASLAVMAKGIIRALEAKPGSRANDVVFHGQLHYSREGSSGEKRRQVDRRDSYHRENSRQTPIGKEWAARRDAPIPLQLCPRPNTKLAPVKPAAAKRSFQYPRRGTLGRLI